MNIYLKYSNSIVCVCLVNIRVVVFFLKVTTKIDSAGCLCNALQPPPPHLLLLLSPDVRHTRVKDDGAVLLLY